MIFDQIRQDVADFRILGNTLLLGDMNAHIGSSSHDYIDLDNIDDFVPLPELGLYQPDTPILRNSQELKETDSHVELLISLCQSSSRRILNGRCRGDSYGKFTHFPINEEHKPSILDFAVSDVELPKNRVQYFNVSHLTFLSDHCCIKISLDVDFNVEIHPNNINTETPPPRYKWVFPYKENFESLLNSKEVKKSFYYAFKYPPTQEWLETAVDEFSTTLNSIAMQVFPQHNKKKKIMPKARKKWHDQSCYALKSELRRLAKQYSLNPQNSIIRKNF